MTQQRGMVIHIAEGYYEGTISWQKNPDANVSSHFVVAGPHDVPKGRPDGKIAQMVDTSTSAWTQRSGNGKWLSVENSGFTPGALSAAQIESNAQLYARGVREYKWPLKLAANPNDVGLGYHSMGCSYNWGHCDCPGPNIIAQLPTILDRANIILNGGVGDEEMKSIREPNGSMYIMSGVDPKGRPLLYAYLSPNAIDDYAAVLGPSIQLTAPIDWNFFVRADLLPPPPTAADHVHTVTTTGTTGTPAKP